MEKLIQEGLPGVDGELVLKVTQHLKDLGMAYPDDCQYVEADYLTDILKPIQVKKLLSYFSKYISGSLNTSGHEIIHDIEFEEEGNLIVSKSPFSFPINTSMNVTENILNPIPTPSTSTNFFNECNKNWASDFIIPWNLFPKEAIDACGKKERMRKCTYSEVVRILSENISRNTPSPGRKNLRIIAKKCIDKYPATFEDKCGPSTIADGCTTLMKKIEHCLENRKRRKDFTDLFEDANSKNLKKTPRNSYACNNWQPSKLPEGESKITQIAHKNWLLSENKKVIRDENKIKEIMELTYASQRFIINSKNSVETIKKEWPILFENNFFFNHANILLGKEDISNEIYSNINVKAKTIYDFMKHKTKKEAVKKCLNEIEIAEDPSRVTVGAIILIAAYFEEEKEELFQINMDPVSSEEIETRSEILTPFIATSGGDIFTAEEFLILIDGVIAFRANDFMTAVALWILSFYVFNIEYPEKGALTLEFIQRIFADINPHRGSKAPRSKRTKSVVHKDILNFANALRDYESHFNL